MSAWRTGSATSALAPLPCPSWARGSATPTMSLPSATARFAYARPITAHIIKGLSTRIRLPPDIGSVKRGVRRSLLQRDDLRLANAVEDVHRNIAAVAAQHQVHAGVPDRHATHVQCAQGFGQAR